MQILNRAKLAPVVGPRALDPRMSEQQAAIDDCEPTPIRVIMIPRAKPAKYNIPIKKVGLTMAEELWAYAEPRYDWHPAPVENLPIRKAKSTCSNELVGPGYRHVYR